MPASPLPRLMTGVAQRTIASDRSLWRDLDPGRPHAHLRADAMQGRVAHIVALAGLTWRGCQSVSPPAPRTRRRRRRVPSDGSTPRSARAANPRSRARRAVERSPRASATETSTA
jgi:hypothetical protein